MNNLVKQVLLSFDILDREPICKKKVYYWIEGYKYFCFIDDEINDNNITGLLNQIGDDCKNPPFNSNYLIIVIAKTSSSFKGKDLYFARDIGENIALFLKNEKENKIYYPTGLVLPLRYSYRKIIKKLIMIMPF